MTIKEIEAKSGLDRATIRFYEKEGFIQVERLPNGYRKYSAYNLDVLLKIKLLRQLGLSLDDLRTVISKEENLLDVLKDVKASLSAQVEEQKRAGFISEQLIRDHVDFETLDARAYLNRAQIEPVAAPVEHRGRQVTSDTLTIWDRMPYVKRPLRRLAARTFDYLFYYYLIQAALRVSLGYDPFLTNASYSIVSLAAFVLMLALEPFLLYFFKTTAGKRLFLLSIEDSDGKALPLDKARSRTWNLFVRGLGLGIPIYNLICMYRQIDILHRGERTDWDQFLAYRQKPARKARQYLFIPLTILIVFLHLGIQNWSHLPPNRGTLDLLAFTENYNYYVRSLGFDTNRRHMDEDGNLQQLEELGSVSVDILDMPTVIYNYEFTENELTGVFFQVSIQDEKQWISSFDTDTSLIMLSLMGANKDERIALRMQNKLASHIPEDFFSSYQFELYGYKVSVETSHSGYVSTGINLLMPIDASKQHDFQYHFRIEKL